MTNSARELQTQTNLATAAGRSGEEASLSLRTMAAWSFTATPSACASADLTLAWAIKHTKGAPCGVCEVGFGEFHVQTRMNLNDAWAYPCREDGRSASACLLLLLFLALVARSLAPSGALARRQCFFAALELGNFRFECDLVRTGALESTNLHGCQMSEEATGQKGSKSDNDASQLAAHSITGPHTTTQCRRHGRVSVAWMVQTLAP